MQITLQLHYINVYKYNILIHTTHCAKRRLFFPLELIIYIVWVKGKAHMILQVRQIENHVL